MSFDEAVARLPGPDRPTLEAPIDGKKRNGEMSFDEAVARLPGPDRPTLEAPIDCNTWLVSFQRSATVEATARPSVSGFYNGAPLWWYDGARPDIVGGAFLQPRIRFWARNVRVAGGDALVLSLGGYYVDPSDAEQVRRVAELVEQLAPSNTIPLAMPLALPWHRFRDTFIKAAVDLGQSYLVEWTELNVLVTDGRMSAIRYTS